MYKEVLQIHLNVLFEDLLIDSMEYTLPDESDALFSCEAASLGLEGNA